MISAAKMETIAQKKIQHINDLDVLRKNYIIAIYKGIANKKSVREIHRDLLNETIINIENKLAINNNLLSYAKRLTTKVVNKAKEKEQENAMAIIFKIITSGLVFKQMQSIIHDSGRNVEADYKNNLIHETLVKNRAKPNPIIFYLASKHLDCAEDHKDYQGKVYVDEKWRKLVKDKDLKEMVSKYIERHNVKTFQWVIGRPVWFITRPNCRHFFKSLDTLTILNNSADSLRELYNLNKIVGDRQLMQTIRHDTRKEWYKKTNVKNIIRQYEDRLDLHKQLSKVYPTQEIQYAIKKDKLLIKKWKEYYKKHF